MRFFLSFFFFLAALFPNFASCAEDLGGVEAELVFESDCFSLDTASFKGAVKFTIPQGMHTYWKFPGQTGEATDIKVRTFPNMKISDIKWQRPEIFDNYGFYEIGYSDKAWHFFDILSAEKIREKEVVIEADVNFLQCSTVCEPREVKLSFNVPVCNFSHLNEEFQKEYEHIVTPSQEQEIFNKYNELIKNIDKEDENGAENKNNLPSLPKDKETGYASLIQVIVLAFLGGIILNLMPCVLPVVSLKITGLAKAGRKSIKKDSIYYGFGIIFSFISVWLFISMIRASGDALGWGFQLQNPVFVLFLFGLLLVLGLMFSGVIIVSPNISRLIKDEQGAFASGVLAVVLASPCVAPFMGTALAYALVADTFKAFLVFLFLGLGLAFPVMLLAFFTGWIKFLPKTKRWNVMLERILSLPLYISALWLLWVVYIQTGFIGLTIGLLLSLFIILAALFHNKFLWGFAIVVFLGASFFMEEKESAAISTHNLDNKESISWENFSAERLSEAISEGKGVFIDFTAGWCLTCLANEKVVLERERTAKLFKQADIVALRADFTLKDEEITKALADYGRRGVPLYVYYPPRKGNEIVSPVFLPQILTFNWLEKVILGEK